MRTSGWIFTLGFFFFVPVAIIYGFVTDFQEWVGLPAILLVGGMTLMIGLYLWTWEKKHPQLPMDDVDGEIEDEYYEYGFYTPWSWWPIVLAAGGAICFLAVAAGWWIFPFGGAIVLVGLIGLVYEHDRGIHAH